MERVMLWIARNKNSTPKLTVDNDDLSSWEIINSSEDERPGFVQLDNNEHLLEGNNNAMVVPEVLFATKSDDPILTVPDPSLLDPRCASSESLVSPCDDQRCRLDEYHQRSRSNDDDDDNDNDDDDEVDYDYDHYGFGNQRMGKVGKKVNRGMMKKSKKLPRYFYNKMA